MWVLVWKERGGEGEMESGSVDVDCGVGTFSFGYAVVSDIATSAERGGFIGAVLLGYVTNTSSHACIATR